MPPRFIFSRPLVVREQPTERCEEKSIVSAADNAAEDDYKKRVFVYVPFTSDETKCAKHNGVGDSKDYGDPNFSADQWTKGRGRLNDQHLQQLKKPKKPYLAKTYRHISGPLNFAKEKFRDGDRFYIHAHGNPATSLLYNQMPAERAVAISKVWDDMNGNAFFKQLGRDPEHRLDLRLAVCHSAEDHAEILGKRRRSYEAEAEKAKKWDTDGKITNLGTELRKLIKLDELRYVDLKGKHGEMSANQTRATRADEKNGRAAMSTGKKGLDRLK
jgi:hypothetical protein